MFKLDTASIIQAVILVLLLLLSAFFSSAETSLTTINPIKVRTLIENGNKRAMTLQKVTEQHGKMLSAILIGNNIVNISASSLATTMAIDIWGNFAVGIATGILTILVLLFGEIMPKNIAMIKAEPLALFYAPIIYGLMWILTPVIFIIDTIAGFFLKLVHINTGNHNILCNGIGKIKHINNHVFFLGFDDTVFMTDIHISTKFIFCHQVFLSGIDVN